MTEQNEKLRPIQKFGRIGEKVDNFLKKSFTDIESKEYALVNNFIVILIFVSIILIIFESVEAFKIKFVLFFSVSEYIIVGIFTIEYLLNIYFSKINTGKNWKYLITFWGIIDLLAILPTYVMMLNLSALKSFRIFRILRFLRMLRILKLTKHAADNVKKAKDKKTNTLIYDLQIYAFALMTAVVVFGTLAYFAENGSNPLFKDIPSSMWWCLVTITTVGYGDMFPITTLGKLVAVPTMLSGLVLFGILMNVIGKAMMDLLFGKGDDDKEDAELKTKNLSSVINIIDETGDKTFEINIKLDKNFKDKEKVKKMVDSILMNI